MSNERTVRVTDPDGFSALIDPGQIDQTTGVTGLGTLLTSLRERRTTPTECPLCSWTLEESVRTGLMGCGLCYTVLYPEWDRLRRKA